MTELNIPQRIKKIILEGGEEIEINLPPRYANIDRWEILITIPIKAKDWEKFFVEEIKNENSKRKSLG